MAGDKAARQPPGGRKSSVIMVFTRRAAMLAMTLLADHPKEAASGLGPRAQHGGRANGELIEDQRRIGEIAEVLRRLAGPAAYGHAARHAPLAIS